MTLEQFNALNEMIGCVTRPEHSFTLYEYLEMCKASGEPKRRCAAEYGLKKLVAQGILKVTRCMVTSVDGTVRLTNCYYFKNDANRTVESGAGFRVGSQTRNKRNDTGQTKAGKRRRSDTGHEIE